GQVENTKALERNFVIHDWGEVVTR
ncbi:hypothetical protein WCM_01169, partial [Escherichia coli KTE10]